MAEAKRFVYRLARLRAWSTEALARRRIPLGFVAGALVLWLATPSGGSLLAGTPVAVFGEALRLWAAGHLNKSNEVTAYEVISALTPFDPGARTPAREA